MQVILPFQSSSLLLFLSLCFVGKSDFIFVLEIMRNVAKVPTLLMVVVCLEVPHSPSSSFFPPLSHEIIFFFFTENKRLLHCGGLQRKKALPRSNLDSSINHFLYNLSYCFFWIIGDQLVSSLDKGVSFLCGSDGDCLARFSGDWFWDKGSLQLYWTN